MQSCYVKLASLSLSLISPTLLRGMNKNNGDDDARGRRANQIAWLQFATLANFEASSPELVSNCKRERMLFTILNCSLFCTKRENLAELTL